MYWVYENWRARGHKAVIHLDECGFCNNGRGVTTGTRPDNGRWKGPFPSPETARHVAERTGGNVKICRCLDQVMQRRLSNMELNYRG